MITNKELLKERLEEFDRRSHALKLYSAFRWGEDLPCPTRFVVSPYKSCAYRCSFCYIWANYGSARQKDDFRESLTHDIKSARELSLDGIITMVSPSTEPFQPIERKFRDSQFAIQQLLANNFPVLIMTRNPGLLLEQEYSDIINDPRLFIDVSISSLHESPHTPSLSDRFDAIKLLSQMRKLVRTKVDPVIPKIEGIKYQTEEELKEIVRLSKEAGSRAIIAKTMRLNNDVPEGIRKAAIEYNNANGRQSGVNLVLSTDLKKSLLTPILNACVEYGIPFCPCVDSDSFSDERTVGCMVIKESNTPITNIIKRPK